MWRKLIVIIFGAMTFYLFWSNSAEWGKQDKNQSEKTKIEKILAIS